MPAFCQTVCGTGGEDRFVDDLGVTGSRDGLLCNENYITDRAVLAFGFAGGGAGCRDCLVDNLSVSSGRDGLLCNEDYITDRAVLALGLAGGGAGGGYFLVDDLGVSLGVCVVVLVAVGATGAGVGGVALGGTGGGCDLGGVAVTQSCYSFLLDENFITDRAMFTLGFT